MRVTNFLLQDTIRHLAQSLAAHTASLTSLKIYEGAIDPADHPGIDRADTLKKLVCIQQLSRVVIQSGPETREWPVAPPTMPV